MRVLAMWSLIVLLAYVLPAQEKNDRTPYLAVDGTYGVWAYSRDLAAGPSLVLRDRHFISGSGIIHRISIRHGTNYGAGIGYRFFFRQVNARRINFFLTTSMRFIRMNMSEYYARWNWLTAPWSLPSESSSLSHSLGTGISFRLSRFVGWISAICTPLPILKPGSQPLTLPRVRNRRWFPATVSLDLAVGIMAAFSISEQGFRYC